MVTIKIETMSDGASEQVYVEVNVDRSPTPVLRSEPSFSSHEELVAEILDMCRSHFPDHTLFVGDPTIGV